MSPTTRLLRSIAARDAEFFRGAAQADPPYRILLVGDPDAGPFAGQQSLISTDEMRREFEEIVDAAGDTDAPETSIDVLVIGPYVSKPIETAVRLRRRAELQVVFLGEAERLDRLRTSLPYVPQLSDAWTAEAEAPAATVIEIILQAAREARRRAGIIIIRDRINAHLAALAARRRLGSDFDIC